MVMKHNKTLKLLSALLAGVMVFTPLSSGVAPAFAAEESSSSEQESTTAPEKTEEEGCAGKKRSPLLLFPEGGIFL